MARLRKTVPGAACVWQNCRMQPPGDGSWTYPWRPESCAVRLPVGRKAAAAIPAPLPPGARSSDIILWLRRSPPAGDLPKVGRPPTPLQGRSRRGLIRTRAGTRGIRPGGRAQNRHTLDVSRTSKTTCRLAGPPEPAVHLSRVRPRRQSRETGACPPPPPLWSRVPWCAGI